ncbi:unnamed protein product [Laminaria digitata]
MRTSALQHEDSLTLRPNVADRLTILLWKFSVAPPSPSHSLARPSLAPGAKGGPKTKLLWMKRTSPDSTKRTNASNWPGPTRPPTPPPQFIRRCHPYARPPHERFLVGCSSPFMLLVEHLTALRAWC